VIEVGFERSCGRKDTTENIALGSGVVLLLVAGLGCIIEIDYIKKSRDIIWKSVTGRKFAPEYPSAEK